MASIGVADSVSDGEDHLVVGGNLPGLEVIAAHPHDQIRSPIPPSKELAVAPGPCHAIHAERREEPAGLDRVEVNEDSLARRGVEHLVDTLEVGLVWARQVVLTGR